MGGESTAIARVIARGFSYHLAARSDRDQLSHQRYDLYAIKVDERSRTISIGRLAQDGNFHFVLAGRSKGLAEDSHSQISSAENVSTTTSGSPSIEIPALPPSSPSLVNQVNFVPSNSNSKLAPCSLLR